MLKVKDIMTSEVFVLHATQTLELVRSLMRIKHVRHVPIVEPDNTFVGLMTHRDLLAQTISHLADVDEEEQELVKAHAFHIQAKAHGAGDRLARGLIVLNITLGVELVHSLVVLVLIVLVVSASSDAYVEKGSDWELDLDLFSKGCHHLAWCHGIANGSLR